MADYTRFWMVYGLRQGAPTFRHKTEQSAIAEASRLARQRPDMEFFVLESTHHVVKRDVDVTILTGALKPYESPRDYGDDIPF